MKLKLKQSGFTIIEVAIVLLIVAILLGYTVALFPKQQELKQYRAADREMDEVVSAIVAFAQVNGRLPCPATPTSGGNEAGGGASDCTFYGGFVPAKTLGIDGKLNADFALIDPWGFAYRYYVTNIDFNSSGGSDFVRNGEMRLIGLVDSDADGVLDLDGRYIICDTDGTTDDDECAGATEVFGNFTSGPPDTYEGAPFVLFSAGKNWAQTPTGDELENMGSHDYITDLGMTQGPAGDQDYRFKDVDDILSGGIETTFVSRPTGLADDFDDIVKWASPNILYSKMIEAGQLP